MEEVSTNSGSNTVTHVVVGKGFLLKEHKMVPAFWVGSMDDEKIRLSVRARVFDRLPDYDPDQWSQGLRILPGSLKFP